MCSTYTSRAYPIKEAFSLPITSPSSVLLHERWLGRRSVSPSDAKQDRVKEEGEIQEYISQNEDKASPMGKRGETHTPCYRLTTQTVPSTTLSPSHVDGFLDKDGSADYGSDNKMISDVKLILNTQLRIHCFLTRPHISFKPTA